MHKGPENLPLSLQFERVFRRTPDRFYGARFYASKAATKRKSSRRPINTGAPAAWRPFSSREKSFRIRQIEKNAGEENFFDFFLDKQTALPYLRAASRGKPPAAPAREPNVLCKKCLTGARKMNTLAACQDVRSVGGGRRGEPVRSLKIGKQPRQSRAFVDVTEDPLVMKIDTPDMECDRLSLRDSELRNEASGSRARACGSSRV